MSEKASIAILCGGKSKRFGSNKVTHDHAGKPLYRHVFDKVSNLSDDVFLQVGGRGEPLPGRVNRDSLHDAGPMGGILSALEFARHDRLFVVACDMLFLDVRIFDELFSVEEADIVVPRWRNGRTEPLCAIYSKSVKDAARRLLQEGRARVASLFSEVDRTAYLDIEALMEQGRIRRDCFVNINEPKDLPPSD